MSKRAVVIQSFNQQIFMLDLLPTKHFSKFCWNNEEQDLVSDLNLNDAQIYIYIYISPQHRYTFRIESMCIISLVRV